MVRSGETAGNLEEVLERLAEFVERELDLKAKVTGTLLYPAVMVVVSMVVLAVLMMVVVPKITQIFADMERALPWNTALLIKISSFSGKYWWLILITLAVLGVLFTFWSLFDRVKLNLPLFGMIVRYLAVSRFTRTLGTMFQAGVPLLRALDISKFVLSNVILQQVITNAQEGIREGDSIANQLKKSRYFEPMVIHMVAVGERSGQLSMMLHNVAEAYEKQVEVRLSRLTTLLEPLMIVVMGGTVAFVIFSIIIPILQMNEVVQ
jgi:general secretion pathway protein F